MRIALSCILQRIGEKPKLTKESDELRSRCENQELHTFLLILLVQRTYFFLQKWLDFLKLNIDTCIYSTFATFFMSINEMVILTYKRIALCTKLQAPVTLGSGEGLDHIGSYARSLTLHYFKRLFPRLETATY